MIVLKIIYLHNYKLLGNGESCDLVAVKQILPMYIIHDDIFEIHLFSQIIKLVLIIYIMYTTYT